MTIGIDGLSGRLNPEFCMTPAATVEKSVLWCSPLSSSSKGGTVRDKYDVATPSRNTPREVMYFKGLYTILISLGWALGDEDIE
jgi:hypothetical protein